MNKSLSFFITSLFIILTLQGCRAWRSDKPAFHINPNLDWQAKFKTQQLSKKSPIGTIPWGDSESFHNPSNRVNYIKNDISFFKGKQNNNQYIYTIPINIDKDFLELGQKQFNIYCAACHTKTGNGTKSLISKKGWVVPNINLDSTVNKTDGEIFDIISNGIRSMPSYSKQIEVSDRWAIVAYIRALQKSSNYSYNKLSNKEKSNLK